MILNLIPPMILQNIWNILQVMTPYMRHIFGGEITMKFAIVELIGPKAFVICVQDLMTQTKRKKYIMICTIGGSKMLAVRNIIIEYTLDHTARWNTIFSHICLLER